MSRNGDAHQPTREFPEYPKGRATAPDAPSPWSDDSAEAVEPADDRPTNEPPAAGPHQPPSGRNRGLLLFAGVAGVVLLLFLGVQATGLLPSWRNPFVEEETDRSQPPLLKSIQDLSRYVAAEGNFQVVIDLERDRKYVPDFLLSERTLFVGAGSVEAYVDFAQISEGAVVESADGQSVEIRLPGPQLGDANLDLENSYVFAEERGLLNRLGEVFGGDPNRQREVYRLAEERITAAARDTGLADRAQENTRKMLEGLLRSLGYETVTVTFTAG
ncbi:DUF4230 domain-containing protein [Polymorphospora rubra]|uniref:DUF4230 domain-containing protein n=1 Tax=Polymorphospora rubra TaxID=338584 RepID=A0A810N078_9ACTN|nr:DUF4230 domain-containing protein [Polymorphospora rubra]BCJ64995.1 hypothetical protein Prubr_20160 [Polymorphospora rubra]